ncbi:MAG: hypothetical protein WD825_11660 [Gemmatimonadaceae bacterium]
MRLRALALLVSTTACDIFAPNGPRSFTIELPFCGPSAIALTWAAVKHDGEAWTHLTPTAGIVSLRASGTLTVAYGNASATRVYSASADELSQVSCLRPANETKFHIGSVRDVGADEQFFVSVGSISVSETPFTVFVPDGPLTVVARTAKTNTGVPHRVIVRQGVNLPASAEIPILDFSSNEARPFESAHVTVTSDGESALWNAFLPRGNRHDLFFGLVADETPVQYFGVPEPLLGPEDHQVLEIRNFNSSSSTLQELAYYYRRARDTHVTVGPPPSTPTGSVLSATPCTRLRARIPAQPEYPSFVIVQFQVDNTILEVGVTREFLGQTPSSWTVDVPDLARPDGTCLLPANLASWSASVIPQEGRLALHLGGTGRDGEVRRWSTGWLQP